MNPDLSNLVSKDEVTSIAMCCKLSLTNGVILGFTSNTEALLIDKLLYKPKTLLSISSIETTNNLAVDNLDITGVLDSLDIKEADILAGRYDFAEVEIFSVNVLDITQKTIHRRGWLGEVTIRGEQFVAEIRGLTQKLQCNIGELYSPSCRAIFGDKRCKASPANIFVEIVDNVDIARQIFTAKPDGGKVPPVDYFASGKVTWLSGNNEGLVQEIKKFRNRQFILTLPMPNAIEKGDSFLAVPGCDKSFKTCCNTFNNAINFRGEPHVPGLDKIFATPGTTDNLKHG